MLEDIPVIEKEAYFSPYFASPEEGSKVHNVL